MLGRRGLIPIDAVLEAELDQIALGGAPGQTLGTVLDTVSNQGLQVSYVLVADLSGAGLPGDYTPSLSFEGVLSSAEAQGQGMGGTYYATGIYGFQLP